MILDVFIAILFLASAIVQVSFINSLGFPLFLFPLHFILGLLIFHRTKPELGVAWFIFSAFTLPLFGFDQFAAWSYILLAVLGVFFTRKLFTTRSLYALLGFGVSMFVIFILANILDHSAKQLFSTVAQPAIISFKNFGLSLVFLIGGLYIAYVFSRFLERIAREVFLIKET